MTHTWTWLNGRLVATLLLVLVAATSAEAGFMVRFLGHAAFQVTSPGGTVILIDPFLSQNPQTPASFQNLSQYDPDAILVSHSHSDHTADARTIANASGALVIGSFDHVNSLKISAQQKSGGNPGGAFTVGDVTIHIVPAVHSSDPGGRPVGFVLVAQGASTVYFTGDTWLFGDMALIQELFRPAVILLQAGGGAFNQDPETAALAISKYFNPSKIVPMHFDTFPGLATEADVRAAFAGNSRLTIMTPGEIIDFN